MRPLSLIFFLLFFFACSGPHSPEDASSAPGAKSSDSLKSKEGIKLEWKIPKGEVLSYRTAERVLYSSDPVHQLDSLLSSRHSFDGGEEMKEFRKGIEAMRDSLDSMKRVTHMIPMEDSLIRIVMGDKDRMKIDLDTGIGPEGAEDIWNGILLNGSVRRSGKIHSFWLKPGPKNLLALMFELPEKRVSVGDRWELDVQLVNTASDFICDSSYRLNEVQLQGIEEVEGDSTAFLSYRFAEYISGYSSTNSIEKGKESRRVELRLEFHGKAEFNIEKGRWSLYEGIMEQGRKGGMDSKSRTHFSLVRM